MGSPNTSLSLVHEAQCVRAAALGQSCSSSSLEKARGRCCTRSTQCPAVLTSALVAVACQVPRSLWQAAEHALPEGIHLQSCGDLSSTSSLRRLLSARQLECSRPRSLNGVYKESIL